MRKGSVGLIGLVLVAACGSSAPTPPPTPMPTHLPSPAASASAPASASPSASSLPADALPAPDGSDGEQVLLHNASGDYDVYKGIGRLDGLGSSCTFVLLATASDEAADTAPAYILSNGHCVGLFDPSTVIVDQSAPEGMATFNFFADATDREAVPTAKIAWATMKGVDLALIQLGTTLGELIRLGYRPWPIDAPPAQSTPLVIVGAPVGVPIVDIPESERFLRAGTCDAGAGDLRVNERQWLWTGMTENACPEILPGNSGSPVLDRARGTLVRQVRTAEELINRKPGQTLVAGLIATIALPILFGIVTVTVIGAPIGLAMLLIGLPLLAFVGWLVAAIWVGDWLLGKRGPVEAKHPYKAALLGVIVLGIAGILPFISAIATLFGVGAVVLAAWNNVRPADPQPAAFGPENPAGWPEPMPTAG